MLHVSRFAQFMLWQLGHGQSPTRALRYVNRTEGHEKKGYNLAWLRPVNQALQTRMQYRPASEGGCP
jgi:hypothetical protein